MSENVLEKIHTLKFNSKSIKLVLHIDSLDRPKGMFLDGPLSNPERNIATKACVAINSHLKNGEYRRVQILNSLNKIYGDDFGVLELLRRVIRSDYLKLD